MEAVPAALALPTLALAPAQATGCSSSAWSCGLTHPTAFLMQLLFT